MLALARRGTARPLVPLRLELARRRSDETMLRRYFTCDVSFDAPADVLVLDASALAHPFVTQNEDANHVIASGLEAALRQNLQSRSLPDDVTRVLRRKLSAVGVESVADELHMTVRTLQRRLAQHGTSYQELLDDVRASTARRLLLDTNLTVGEIALLLGFDELRSFARAFRTWEGVSPAQWRERVS
jgi:AraC-like DNA-binding protein